MMLNNSDQINQDVTDLLADDKIFFDENGGKDKVAKDYERSQVINAIKFNMVCDKFSE